MSRGRTEGHATSWRSPWVVLMNLTAYPLMILWTVVGIGLFLPAFLVARVATGWDSSRVMRELVWLYGRGWMVSVFPFVRFRRQGFQGHGVRPPCIFVVNHLSFLDTYCMAALPFPDLVFAVRSWPFKMFWYAPFMRLAGYLDVESMSWEECAEACRKIFAEGGSVLFFPEGHRSRTGALQRFYSGAFRLAVETGVPVVPLCLAGTDVLLPPTRWWLHPARVQLRMLPPVDPGGFAGPSGHGELRKRVKRAMAGALDEMRAAAERTARDDA